MSGKMRNFAAMKRLDMFMLRQFLPLFAMTFFICTFIVLMQFLWLHLQDLVGKGLGFGVLSELFFYAALSMVPMALPLAVLLASLMTFGNLGESMELTALKAGGISLFRVMQPLIVLMAFVAVGAFFFQNNVLPLAQTKMWTLLKSMRQKTPELDIVEGEFNYQLPNINIYVGSKNRETGMLYEVMIYDMQQGFERSRVILADSATLTSAADKRHMHLTLHHGELFENLRDATGMNHSARNQLYRREEFHRKEISVAFDMNFERMEEQDIRATYAGKNVAQLRHSIDSIHNRIDSIGRDIGREVSGQRLVSFSTSELPPADLEPTASPKAAVNPDSARNAMTREARKRYIYSARSALEQKKMNYLGRALYMEDDYNILRRHGIELQKKFTLSLACLVFFFIGAPLGAIIRKGGLGTPLVISVFLFIFYYIIDNSGYRLARDGKVAVWQGMWLSSGVLLPLGIFVTYKAVHDSAVFNADSYKRLLRIITGKNARALGVKEVIIEDMEPQRAMEMLANLAALCSRFQQRHPRPCGYQAYWRGGIPSAEILELSAALEHTVSYLANTRSQQLMDLLNTMPQLENFAILHPAHASVWSRMCYWLVPLGAIVWIVSLVWQRRLLGENARIKSIIPDIENLLQEKSS